MLSALVLKFPLKVLPVIVERVEESYEFLLSQEAPKEDGDREVYPDVIVIMNESWWNTDNIDTDWTTFSRDPMEPYKELADRCITGYQTTNVFGGGTVAPEMEFLTGLNAKYYRADSIYTQMQGRKLPSLADYFNGLDYETVAIHRGMICISAPRNSFGHSVISGLYSMIFYTEKGLAEISGSQLWTCREPQKN